MELSCISGTPVYDQKVIQLYPVHVGLNMSGANRTHLALTFI
jgi:hypothetical protein